MIRRNGELPSSDSDRSGRIRGRTAYRGRVLDVHVDLVRFPDGSRGELEIVRHRGAAAVVPLFERGRDAEPGPTVLLLKQYRYAAGGPIWEVPAGKLDGGESPERCARRELEEEAGVVAGSLRRLGAIWTTPGFTDERIHLFLASALEPGRTAHEAHEFIERHEIPLARALEWIRSGEISDAKTVCALWLAADVLGAAPGGDGNDHAGDGV